MPSISRSKESSTAGGLLLSLLFLCLTGFAQAGTLRILVLGSSQPLKSTVEAAFPPTTVASNLQQILASDPNLAGTTITVTGTDIYQSQSFTATGVTQTLQSRTLMSWYYWPASHAATLALLAQGWDYVVLIDDPTTAYKFPEYSAEGVRSIANEVLKAGSHPLLVMTWSSGNTSISTFGGSAYRVGAGTGVPVVPAGYAWNSLTSALKGTGTRPNLQGNYLTASSIYSQIYNRAASTSSFVPTGLSSTDANSIAAAALTSVQTEPGKTHYSGTYTGPTHFSSPALKKRNFTYTDFNSSTEWGIRGGFVSVLAQARVNFTETISGTYQSFPTTGFPYDFCQSRFYNEGDNTSWTNYSTFDYQDDSGGTSMLAGVDRVMYAAGLPEQDSGASNVSSYYISQGEFFAPVRVFWSRVGTQHPEIPPQPDGHHMSEQYDQGIASMMYALLSGRCAVGDAPADTSSTAWQDWFCRKTGYEIAWQAATLQNRVPGFEILPAGANLTQVTTTAPTTLTARFLYPPLANVTVAVSSDNLLAGTVSPQTLTFTPQNYNLAQTVTLNAVAGAAAGTAFNVNFSTSSTDAIFTGLNDQWAYNIGIPPGPGHGITWEYFANISGSQVTDLTSNSKFINNQPDQTSLLTSLFETPSNYADNYGNWVRGYFIAPVSGSYSFWIAADDTAQLSLSTSTDPAAKQLIASVPSFTASEAWTQFPSQHSANIALVAGQRYYIEALHKEATGGDNLAVGVTLPGGSAELPMPANRLDPWGALPPTVAISSPADQANLGAPASVALSATAADPDGTVASVAFLANGTPLGSASSAPFTFTWNNPAPGNYALTAVATDNSGNQTTSAAVNVVIQAPIEAWRSAKFGAQASQPQAANSADPDGDGLSNLMEYALGLNPLVPDSSGLPTAAIVNNQLTLTYQRQISATDITYIVEASSDLLTWSTAGITQQSSSQTLTQQTMVATDAVIGASKRFMRLRITNP